MDYNDRLYGFVRIEKPVEELLRCEKIQRLKNISLSAVPDAFLVPSYFKDMASRLEHSVGVSHLVGVLYGSRREFREYRNALLLSAVCHDAGVTPFSHSAEHLLEELTGLNHEQYTKHILKNSAAQETMEKYGYSLKRIADIISGKSELLGKIMNNTIDLDNADNTERYGFSSGIVGRISNPENIAKAFMLRDGKIFLDGKYSKEVEKWKICRKKVYGRIVYGDTNMSAGGMLRRALGFVYEEKGKMLKRDGFLEFGDNEALQYMEENSREAKILIGRARSGLFYKKIAEISSFDVSCQMEELCKNWSGRLELADSVCERFNLQRHDVCVQAFRQKPDRNVSNFYPAKTKMTQENLKINFDIRVFANPQIRANAKNMRKALCELADMQQ